MAFSVKADIDGTVDGMVLANKIAVIRGVSMPNIINFKELSSNTKCH